MVKFVRTAQAGSLESCDILVTITKGKEQSGVKINLESSAKKQFGDRIIAEIMEVVKKFGVTDIVISAVDKGALTYCIQARTEAAIKRAFGVDEK
ncbi:MAG: citrate lyase acyl carrier protein [Candidatus Heimdallarchaeota archaeon]